MVKRIFVAMSGGVDSSVAAYLLTEAGYEVQGIHLELSYNSFIKPETEHSVLERSCELLKIPLHYLHLEIPFKRNIIDYFCQEYSLGRTPNPCIRCNQTIKFGLLLEKVLEMGGDYLATGHYARVNTVAEGFGLYKGVDKTKDQSYFLYVLGQKQLEHVLFPLGGMTKKQVKQIAASVGLPTSEIRESQDVCFIPDNDSKNYLANHLAINPGEIVDNEGNVLGQHRGLAFYTVGQRQGMRISSKERLYVIRLETSKNRLVIGPQAQLFKSRLIAGELNWISGNPPQDIEQLVAKLRYRSPEAKASLQVVGDRLDVCFEEPQRAIASGQSIVFYREDRVIGGGIIEEAF
jgi:tRNA-specific 2-thiouridylase